MMRRMSESEESGRRVITRVAMRVEASAESLEVVVLVRVDEGAVDK